MKRKVIISVCLFVFLISSYLLVTASDLLLYPLFEQPFLPLGNVLSWLGMIALPLSLLYGIKGLYRPSEKWQYSFRWIFKVLIALAILWFPVSYWLSGNFSASFDGATLMGVERYRIYWGYSYVVAFSPLVLLAVYYLIFIVRRR